MLRPAQTMAAGTIEKNNAASTTGNSSASQLSGVVDASTAPSTAMAMTESKMTMPQDAGIGASGSLRALLMACTAETSPTTPSTRKASDGMVPALPPSRSRNP